METHSTLSTHHHPLTTLGMSKKESGRDDKVSEIERNWKVLCAGKEEKEGRGQGNKLKWKL